MPTITAACNAMATRFEVVVNGQNPGALRAAAEAALHEIERLHAQLSLYLPSSELAFINAHAADRPVPVEPGLFRLLQLAQTIHQETDGAFDITIAPLVRCWGFMGGSGALPTPEQVAEARALVGMDHVLLNPDRFTVQFARPGIMLDLGSIGKGYALDIAMETLIEAGVESALIHGGTSTVCALGKPPEADSWKVAIEAPPANGSSKAAQAPGLTTHSGTPAPLAVVELRDGALSVSGVHGKCFQAAGRTFGHIIDPRTGSPAESALLAAVVLPSAAETDAFSTALLLDGPTRHSELNALRPKMRSLVVMRETDSDQPRVITEGLPLLSETAVKTSGPAGKL